AANPKWLIYLPPTMSPSETSKRPGLLEHPSDAFAYYRSQGVATVVCEEKHMGSRAVIVVCRDEEAAKKHFGVVNEGIGVVVTRTGRPFFNDNGLGVALLERLRKAIDGADLWTKLETSWVCIDAELMPWSLKAQELVRVQYAAVGAAAELALGSAVSVLDQAVARGLDVGALSERTKTRLAMATKYRAAYRHYCWPVRSLADVKLAPFHVMAGEAGVYADRDHLWHMGLIASLCLQDPELLVATPHRRVEIAEEASELEGTAWWEELTGRGGEGMVIKPLGFVARSSRGLVQPALKCRGPEYLRIIYGAEYDAPENLERLRARGLSTKRSLALREFALGIEGLERFVRKEPLRRVHECVFGVLALESEPVDPRL
ncbi:MAG: polynucleotide kinase-phosphatase, partial [Polyangiaceae bacterium]